MKTLLFLFLFFPFISFSQAQDKSTKLSNKASDLFENGNFKRAIKVYSKIIKLEIPESDEAP